ncbi:Envelope-like protein [Abeliophyllum distichum]|uniref:Envelope-like protein n=1 Tax=Abeliophyllum distichum TaxID=126358 RepID=A0ABD1REF7_9LAMI
MTTTVLRVTMGLTILKLKKKFVMMTGLVMRSPEQPPPIVEGSSKPPSQKSDSDFDDALDESSESTPTPPPPKRAMRAEKGKGKMADVAKEPTHAGQNRPPTASVGAYRILATPSSDTLFLSFTYFRKFIVECKVSIPEFVVFDLDKIVGFHKLYNLLSFSATFNETLVKEFMANVPKNLGKAGNEFRWQVYVRGRHVNFSPSSLREWLGMVDAVIISDEELTKDSIAQEMTGSAWPEAVELTASRLLPKYKVLHRILINNIDPLTHRSDISGDRMVMLYKLGMCVRVDWVKMIFDRLVYEGPRRAK